MLEGLTAFLSLCKAHSEEDFSNSWLLCQLAFITHSFNHLDYSSKSMWALCFQALTTVCQRSTEIPFSFIGTLFVGRNEPFWRWEFTSSVAREKSEVALCLTEWNINTWFHFSVKSEQRSAQYYLQILSSCIVALDLLHASNVTRWSTSHLTWKVQYIEVHWTERHLFYSTCKFLYLRHPTTLHWLTLQFQYFIEGKYVLSNLEV